MSATRRRGKGVHLGYLRSHLKTKNTGTSGILANTYNLTTWEWTAMMIAKFEGQPRLCELERTCWNIKNATKIISVNLLVQCFGVQSHIGMTKMPGVKTDCTLFTTWCWLYVIMVKEKAYIQL